MTGWTSGVGARSDRRVRSSAACGARDETVTRPPHDVCTAQQCAAARDRARNRHPFGRVTRTSLRRLRLYTHPTLRPEMSTRSLSLRRCRRAPLVAAALLVPALSARAQLIQIKTLP